MFVISRSR